MRSDITDDLSIVAVRKRFKRRYLKTLVWSTDRPVLATHDVGWLADEITDETTRASLVAQKTNKFLYMKGFRSRVQPFKKRASCPGGAILRERCAWPAGSARIRDP